MLCTIESVRFLTPAIVSFSRVDKPVGEEIVLRIQDVETIQRRFSNTDGLWVISVRMKSGMRHRFEMTEIGDVFTRLVGALSV